MGDQLRLILRGGFLALAVFLALHSVSHAALTPGERAEAYYNQGYLYYIEKSYSLAIPEYDKALSLEPNMAKAYYWKAKCHYFMKDYNRAKENLTQATNISPGIYDAPAFMRKIDSQLNATTPVKTTPKPVLTAPPSPASSPSPSPVPEKAPAISMNLRAVEISHAFNLLAKETGQNIVVSKDVHGKITLSLTDVTTQEAFDAILKAGNCAYVTEGSVIRIIPSGASKKIQYLPGGLINKTYELNYVKPDDMSGTLRTILPEGTKVVTTPGSNSMMVEGMEDAIEKADDTIANLDVPPRQVMVEARIVEVSHIDSSALGVNLDYTSGNSETQTKNLATPPTATTATGLFYTVTETNIEGLLETLQTKTGYNLLSSPKVMAMNEKEAEIITGQRLGYKVKTITDTGLIESVEFLDVGTKLVFTPHIKSDDMILMDIHPEISEGSIVNDLPQKKSTETTTQLMVKNGETIIIGGLMKDNTQKVNKGIPFLSEIPFIGVPFRRVEITTEKREIIVLISPRIITAGVIENMKPEADKLEKKRQDEHYSSPKDLIM
jgi:type II secretory pathway component GspD/PulD (secretin)